MVLGENPEAPRGYPKFYFYPKDTLGSRTSCCKVLRLPSIMSFKSAARVMIFINSFQLVFKKGANEFGSPHMCLLCLRSGRGDKFGVVLDLCVLLVGENQSVS